MMQHRGHPALSIIAIKNACKDTRKTKMAVIPATALKNLVKTGIARCTVSMGLKRMKKVANCVNATHAQKSSAVRGATKDMKKTRMAVTLALAFQQLAQM
jgi:hypothetical protein